MARRRVTLSSLRGTLPPSKPPSDWRTRIGCKRSAPNAPPLKKKKPYRGATPDIDVSISHKENWRLSVQCGIGLALRCDSSEHNFSPEGEDVNCHNSRSTEHHLSARGASHLHDMHALHDTSEHNFSPRGEDVNRQNSRSTEHHLSARGASHLHDMHLLHDTSESNYLAVEGDFHLPDFPLKCMTAEEWNEDKEEERMEMIPDLEPNKEVSADNNDVLLSGKGSWSMSWQCGTSEDNILHNGDDLDLQNSLSAEFHHSARGDSHLSDMHLKHHIPESNYSAIEDNLHLPDSLPKYMTAGDWNEDEVEDKIEMIPDLQEHNKGVADSNDVSISDSGNWSMFGQCGSSENFSPKGEDLYAQNLHSTEHHLSSRDASHLPDMHHQHNPPESNCSAIGGDLHLPDSRPKYLTAEELNEDDEASDAESQVDRWACRVCKVAAVSIAVLPCSHLCLCWDCEERTEECPVCGQDKTDVFYINF